VENFYADLISKDPRFLSTKRIADMDLLEPKTRELVQSVMDASAKAGIKLMVFETFRSQARQTELFNQGASTLKEVGVHQKLRLPRRAGTPDEPDLGRRLGRSYGQAHVY
jgi:hypothetical protein